MRQLFPARSTGLPGRATLALAAVVFVFLTGTAFAASSFDISCDDRVGIDASTPALEELDISIVDLSTGDDTGIADPNLYPDDSDAATPRLNLGPRVATIVRDVFGDEADDRISEDERADRQGPIAPLAGSSSQDRAPASLEADDEPADSGAYSPVRIYRKMYRTDI